MGGRETDANSSYASGLGRVDNCFSVTEEVDVDPLATNVSFSLMMFRIAAELHCREFLLLTVSVQMASGCVRGIIMPFSR